LIELGYRFGRTPTELLGVLTVEEFDLLLAEERLNPRSPWRQDLAAGIVASTVANAMGGRKGGGAFAPKDFMPLLAERKPDKANGKSLREKLFAWVGAFDLLRKDAVNKPAES
jgi:hypothetical protein